MNKFTKKIIAYVCTGALVLSSLNVTTFNDVSAAVSDAGSYDWESVDYLNTNADATDYANTIKMHVANGNVGIDIIQGNGIYHTFGDADFGELTINGEVLNNGSDYLLQGAGVFLRPSCIKYKYSEYIVHNSQGGVKATIYIFNKDGIVNYTAIDGPTGLSLSGTIASWTASTAENIDHYEVVFNGNTYVTNATTFDLTTYASELSGGTYQVKVRAVDSSNNYSGYVRTNYVKEYSDGDELMPQDKRNPNAINVGAHTSGETAYAEQYFAEGLAVEQGVYYVVSYTISSSQHRWFQMKLENTIGWSEWFAYNPAYEFEVQANEPLTIAEVVTPNQTINTAKIGIFMGYVHEQSAATTVNISNFSLKRYSSQSAAELAANALLASQNEGPVRPTNLTLTDGILSWDSVDDADFYIVMIGDTVINSAYTTTSINLTSILGELAYGTHTISVIAQNTLGESPAATTTYTKVDPRPQMGANNPLIQLNGEGTHILVAGLDVITGASSYKLYVDGTFFKNVYNGEPIPVESFSAYSAGSHLFQVTGVNEDGESSKSEGYEITLPNSAPTQQTAPTGFEATLTNSNTEVQITWTAPEGDCILYIDDVAYANGVNGRIANGSYVNIANTLNSSTKLTAGNHTFKIATITNDTFGESEQTEAVQLTIPQTAPTEVNDLSVTDGIGKLTVFFQETAAMNKAGHKYSIYVDGSNTASYDKVSQGEYQLTGLTVGAHTVTVKTYVLSNEAGHTSEYLESTGVTETGTVYSLADPTDVVVTGATNVINVSWTDTITTSDYKIYLDGSSTPTVTTAVGATSAQLTDIPAGTHSVVVKAHVLNSESTGVAVNNIIVYDPPAQVDAINVTNGYNGFTASWTDTNPATYNVVVYQNNIPVTVTSSSNTENGTVTYTFTDMTPGSYKIGVTTENEVGDTSEETLANVLVMSPEDEVITSSDIAIEGFQINLNHNSDWGVAFRTVATAPESTVTVGNKTYTIASYGLVYAFDPVNKTGNKENDTIDSTYTILNEEQVSLDGAPTIKYVGKKENSNLTWGHVATPSGMLNLEVPQGKVSYAATMIDLDHEGAELYANSLYVRAYVIATDGTFIYGTQTAKTSIAEIASKMYSRSIARTYTGHQFLYNSILHTSYLSSLENVYYREETVDYGWGNNVYTPSN